jgi:hypothetical protein
MINRKYIVRIAIDAEAETEEGLNHVESSLATMHIGGVRGCGKEGLYSYQHDGSQHIVEGVDDK